MKDPRLAPSFPVRFSTPFPDPGMLAISLRRVYVNDRPVGTLHAIDPAPGRPNRPTAYEFHPDSPGDVERFDRVETARERIAVRYNVAGNPTPDAQAERPRFESLRAHFDDGSQVIVLPPLHGVRDVLLNGNMVGQIPHDPDNPHRLGRILELAAQIAFPRAGQQ